MIVLMVIVGIIVIVGGYLLVTKGFGTSPSQKYTMTPTPEKDISTSVQSGAQVGGNQAVVPGFPASIPVESKGIFESYKTEYAAQGVTQYTVSYKSTKTQSALWDIYNTYFTGAKFDLSSSVNNKANGILYGTKGNVGLFVTISASGNQNVVHLNYVEKK